MNRVCIRSARTILSGSNILVTRPIHQAESLSLAIEKAGGCVVRFPAIEIVARIADQIGTLVGTLDSDDIVVFVSPNAVWHGLPSVLESGDWPENVTTAVVGPGTAMALQRYGVPVHLQPVSNLGARGLLAHPDLQPCRVRGCKVVIFRGCGGLAVLGDELSARGALVTYAEVYDRCIPRQDASALNERGLRGEIDIIVVTSAEALRNLFTLVGPRGENWLRNTLFLVVSGRIARAAKDYRLRHAPLVANGALDHEIVETLVQWREAKV